MASGSGGGQAHLVHDARLEHRRDLAAGALVAGEIEEGFVNRDLLDERSLGVKKGHHTARVVAIDLVAAGEQLEAGAQPHCARRGQR
jgi:hypothetical protein